jgi:hypothetical protein
MNVYFSGPLGLQFDSCNLELQRLLPMNSIRSIRRDRPITRNIISGRVKDASIAIACHLTSNTPQLTFVCQLMLHELASHLPQVSGIVCSVEVHGVRLATVPGFWQVH